MIGKVASLGGATESASSRIQPIVQKVLGNAHMYHPRKLSIIASQACILLIYQYWTNGLLASSALCLLHSASSDKRRLQNALKRTNCALYNAHGVTSAVHGALHHCE